MWIDTRRWRKELLWVVGSATGAVLLLGIAAAYWPGTRDAVSEQVTPDFAALLPEGSSVVATAELPDAPQFAHAVGLVDQQGPALALAVWNKQEQGYVLSSVSPFHGEGYPTSIAALSVESLGLGAPVAVLASGPMGASTDAVVVYARTGDALRVVAMTDADGATRPATFLRGASVTHTDAVSFEDVDGDQDKDAVVTSTEMADAGLRTSVTVYVWRDGAFYHDPDLSRTVSLRSSLFPEPDAEPVATAENENIPVP